MPYMGLPNTGVNLPVEDGTSIVKDPADSTKQVRIDAGNVTTGTTRVLTMKNADLNLANAALTNTVATFTSGQRGEITTLSPAGSSVTPNMNDSNNFTLTMASNYTLQNPTNITVGQSGVIYLVQNATGGWALSFGTYWDFVGGTAPDTTTMTANEWGLLTYEVRTTTSIATQFLGPFS